MQQKTLLTIVGILVLVAGGWFLISNQKTGPQGEFSDTVVRVNDENITRAKLEALEKQIAARQAIDMTSLDVASREQFQAQAIDTLVANALIRQASTKAGITVAEADIDAQIATIKSRFSDDAQFEEALLEQEMSLSDLREQVTEGISTEMYLAQTLDLKSITVLDEEVNALYDQEATAAEGDIPPLTEVREQIELFIVQQKQQQLVAAHVEELRVAADVEILI